MPRKTLKDTTDAAVEKAEKVLDNPVIEDDPDQIVSTLDNLLEVNQDELKIGGRAFINALFIGEAGTGKTSRIKAWAKSRGVNLVSAGATGMDDSDLGGAIAPSPDGKVAIRLSSTEFDELDNVENSVLFIDEFNRAHASVRDSLLTLISDHTIIDTRVKGRERFLKNFLFTIAAINPTNANYDVDKLDLAASTRFNKVHVYADPKVTMEYLVDHYIKLANNAENDRKKLKALRKVELAKALLGSKYFSFDTYKDIEQSEEEGNGEILTARTLTNVFQACDGTKAGLLRDWNSCCNSLKKDMVKKILADYEDVNLDDFEEVDDKATRVLKQKPKEEETPAVFGSSISLADKTRKNLLRKIDKMTK